MIKLCLFGFSFNFALRLGLIVANSITGFSTIVANLLLVVSILRTPSLRKPSHILIANLAVADLLVGAVGQPMFILRDSLLLQKRDDVYDIVCITASVGRAFCYWPSTVSLYTLLVISIDRLLAIKLKTRYSSVVTSKRLMIILIFGWVSNAVIFFPLFLLLEAKSILEAVSIGMMLFIITFSFCYLQAFYELKKVMAQVRSHSEDNAAPANATSSFDVSKYKQSLKTMLIVFATLMICCFPYLISTAALALDYENSSNYFFAVTACEVLLFANSTMNPLLYFWRMKELRQTAGRIVASLLGRKCCQETTVSVLSRSKPETASGT